MPIVRAFYAPIVLIVCLLRSDWLKKVHFDPFYVSIRF
jgi:hypothetical protein